MVKYKTKFSRICERCNKENFFKSEKGMKISIKNHGLKCRECFKKKIKQDKIAKKEIGRKCQKCENIKYFENEKKASNFTLCSSCHGRNKVKHFYKNGDNIMKNKNVYQCWIDKYGEKEAALKIEQHKNRLSRSIKSFTNSLTKEEKKEIYKNYNTNHKSVYQHWVDKYGKEKADEMESKRRAHMSKKMSGSGNPMFGKPSPNESGRGWSGWYKGLHFRSIFELSYLKYLIENKINFKTGESTDFRVEYKDLKGNDRNYYPDYYIVDTQEIIEIKPSYFLINEEVKIKTDNAKKKYGNKYIILTEKDIHILKLRDIIELINQGEDLKFKDKYQQKILTIIEKGKK